MKTKRTLITWILILMIINILIFYKEIPQFIVKNFIYHNYAVEKIPKNEYSLGKDYTLAQITDDFVAKDKQHLLNIFYTILDSGESNFYFYCDENYKDCKKDVDALIPTDQQTDSILADFNNLVHPYNSYKSIDITTNNFGKIVVSIVKQYSNEKIEEINVQLQEIEKGIGKEGTLKDRIKAFHDYIVNNTSYDIQRANHMESISFENSTTHTAYGLLETKKALCGGYSDIMSIYLHQLQIPNIRISANNHVWNLVFLDNNWLHLDVTWDDPVTSTGEELLIYDYFLISYNTLLETDPVEHKFNQEIYVEAK